MPRLACFTCGRQIYTVAPIESLFAEERRCPRCGAFMNEERRGDERRGIDRRRNPADAPGPPMFRGERRHDDRRTGPRRIDGDGRSAAGRSDSGRSDSGRSDSGRPG
ncbi:MAG TPA: hypothetical protein VF802_05645 [Candidatus Limnocylindrales bacterium]